MTKLNFIGRALIGAIKPGRYWVLPGMQTGTLSIVSKEYGPECLQGLPEDWTLSDLESLFKDRPEDPADFDF